MKIKCEFCGKEIDASKLFSIMGSKTGKSKVRGDSEYYRNIAKLPRKPRSKQ